MKFIEGFVGVLNSREFGQLTAIFLLMATALFFAVNFYMTRDR